MEEMGLKEWQVPLAARQTEALRKWKVFLEAAHTGCLARGTPVRMADGSVKNVEDVQAGDIVEAYDDETHTIVPGTVEENIRTCHKPKPMIQFRHENETIKTTYDHYFLTEGGFVPLYQLAWGAMEARQRVQLELLCKRYGSPLDLDAPWWKTSSRNEARKGQERILAYGDGRTNGESAPHRSGKLAVQSARLAVCKPHQLESGGQLRHEPGVVFREVQCVVWRPPWPHKAGATSEAGPADHGRAYEGAKAGKGEDIQVVQGQERKILPEEGGADRQGHLRGTVHADSRPCQGKVADVQDVAVGEPGPVQVGEAEPYYTIRMREAPYAYCIGRRHRIPVHNSGKTYLAAQTVKDLGLRTVVVCPKIAISQWRRVLEGMGAAEYVDAVVNPEQLTKRTGCGLYLHEEGWRTGPDPMLLVWDEVHRGCSGPDSKATLALARWANKSRPGNKVLAMSATPFDSPLKMRALGYLMGFHRFVDSDFYAWCRRHACANEVIGRFPRFRQVFRFTTNPARAKEVMGIIRKEMGERFMSITPDEIPGFPEETREVVLVDLAKGDHDALVKAYAEMPENIRGMSQDDMVKLLRLRQQAEFCKAAAMAEMATGLVEDGNSVFVMLNFTDARLRLQACLEKAGVPYAAIHGGQKEAERQAGIDLFQANRIHVIVGMAAACSVALSLHDERHERPRVSLISPGYSASEFSQGLGRIRRVGGTAAVQKIVIAAGSVEERVGRAIARKMENLSALTDRDFERR